eukprot:CAMPEP_0115527958 /NCGR_PEP_ID=MMETSP0271-20121206/83135_1 /TAXON_ID=71861 /ORGANISM="Scrippsiella trochoidea, Strain CCMP3099" /LENGTH=64 /DNA_ID=CAMNT_0002959847 /DNA_START=354 /DNA_END=548 /DNA_ORIENTATION=-
MKLQDAWEPDTRNLACHNGSPACDILCGSLHDRRGAPGRKRADVQEGTFFLTPYGLLALAAASG